MIKAHVSCLTDNCAKILPGLATTTGTVTNGGKNYKFTLRKGMKYSDGTPIKASDFKNTIIRDFNLNSPGIGFFSNIVGIDACENNPGTCKEIKSLTVHPKDGQPVQKDYGAADVDNKSKHIWLAGYFPVSSGGALRNYFYEVNRNNGLILQSCFVPVFSDGFNDSLTVMKHTDLPGSAEYLVTDGGEFFGTAEKVIDQATCHLGAEATVVSSTNTDHGVTGTDFEWPGLLNANETTLFNNGDYATPLWGPGVPLGPTGATFGTEDISLCGYSATFGGDGSDQCAYTTP